MPFVICLLTLLVNDFYLKTQFHNAVTGKLSDFCGLFVFVCFWSALFPTKKLLVNFLTALLFILWKSPYAQAFIYSFSQNFYGIHRVVDITDLFALIVLPIACLRSTSIKLKVWPLPVGALTFISFCATSIPTPTQELDQPHYVLFKSGVLSADDNKYHPSDYAIHEHDSFVVISVKKIEIERSPHYNDEFHKKLILADLDLRLLRDSRPQYSKSGLLSDYTPLRDSLTFKRRTSISLEHDSIVDVLKFMNTRLDGPFKRLVNGHLRIDGKYKDGVEDSVWNFYNTNNDIVLRKNFKDGELARTDHFEKSLMISSQTHDTRNDAITYKYFHLAIIAMFIIAIVFLLIWSYKKSQSKDIVDLPLLTKITGAIGLPLLVLAGAYSISSVIPNSYSPNFFELFFDICLIYIMTATLFLLLLFWKRLRSMLDILLYLLLFSLAVVGIQEGINLTRLMH